MVVKWKPGCTQECSISMIHGGFLNAAQMADVFVLQQTLKNASAYAMCCTLPVAPDGVRMESMTNHPFGRRNWLSHGRFKLSRPMNAQKHVRLSKLSLLLVRQASPDFSVNAILKEHPVQCVDTPRFNNVTTECCCCILRGSSKFLIVRMQCIAS